MDIKKFVKMSELVGKTFEIKDIKPYVWKMWDPNEKTMKVSQEWQEGYRKMYPATTEHGDLDLSAGQLGQILEALFQNGVADVRGAKIFVKSNGKSGMDIRYFFNKARDEYNQDVEDRNDDSAKDEISLDDMPF